MKSNMNFILEDSSGIGISVGLFDVYLKNLYSWVVRKKTYHFESPNVLINNKEMF